MRRPGGRFVNDSQQTLPEGKSSAAGREDSREHYGGQTEFETIALTMVKQ